jgi:hypothetical protein
VYTDSETNSKYIQSLGHEVRYDLDATKLSHNFDKDNKFDRIQFNFPHWKGKANNRYNRILIKDFFDAASTVVNRPDGIVNVALMDSQGGMASTQMRDWRQSWMPALYAAYSNLLLVNVAPFVVRSYNTSCAIICVNI